MTDQSTSRNTRQKRVDDLENIKSGEKTFYTHPTRANASLKMDVSTKLAVSTFLLAIKKQQTPTIRRRTQNIGQDGLVPGRSLIANRLCN